MTKHYTAESIKIRAEAVHSWEVVASLADRYPFRPVEWLERDGRTPMNPVVNECMVEILRGWRDDQG